MQPLCTVGPPPVRNDQTGVGIVSSQPMADCRPARSRRLNDLAARRQRLDDLPLPYLAGTPWVHQRQRCAGRHPPSWCNSTIFGSHHFRGQSAQCQCGVGKTRMSDAKPCVRGYGDHSLKVVGVLLSTKLQTHDMSCICTSGGQAIPADEGHHVNGSIRPKVDCI